MTPQELFDVAGDVLRHTDATGIVSENAGPFIAALQAKVQSVTTWLPPVTGGVGYGDGQLIDLLRQLKFQSEKAISQFPNGVSALAAGLTDFRLFLQTNYSIHIEEAIDADRH